MIMRIKELREAAGMTQKQVADTMGVLTSAVSNWESEVALPRARQLPCWPKCWAAPSTRCSCPLRMPADLLQAYYPKEVFTMQADCRNIYQAARKVAGLTQEKAAEMIGISVRSLADYETGVRHRPTPRWS